jgi:hypothetical protein
MTHSTLVDLCFALRALCDHADSQVDACQIRNCEYVPSVLCDACKGKCRSVMMHESVSACMMFGFAAGEPFNPIKQDVKNGNPRFLKYGDQLFNYGALPQTWEDPKHISDETGVRSCVGVCVCE